jgi:Tol biopolymer transport system component
MQIIMGNRSRYALFSIFCVLLSCCSVGLSEIIAEGVTLVPLTDDGKSKAVSWAYHDNLIAFVRQIPGGTQSQLLVMNADGSSEKAISPIGNPFFAEWSWTGKKLSYEFSNVATDESQGGVYIYDVLTKRSLSVSAPYLRSEIDEDDGPFWSADDKYVVYKVKVGPSQLRQLWVADTKSGKAWRLLPERGQGKEQRWSSSLPPKICLKIEASADLFDVATVDPDGRNFVLLTDIGAQSIDTDSPRWSPTGEWVAFTSNIDMTQTERQLERSDCWVSRPSGTKARNLTNATSPATEKQLEIGELFWSWDGRWILAEGKRFDNQGNDISTLYLIDPTNGGYWPIMTSYPEKTATLDSFRSAKWSYDSSKIVFLIERRTVRNWGVDPQFEKPRWVLSLYDVREKKVDEILVYDEELDRKQILGTSDKEDIEDISWSPDSRSILLTIATIVSKEGEIFRPDVYRLDLPDRFIDTSAGQHIGPPIGRDNVAAPQPLEPAPPPAQPLQRPVQTQAEFVTETVKPLYMTVAEAVASLPASYAQYFTQNPTRNLLLYKGPPDVLTTLKGDLGLIDTPPPQILVDLLAIELSDEANRNLGLDWTYAEAHFGLFQPAGGAIRDLTPDETLGGLTTFPGVGQSWYQGVGKLPREFFIRLNTLVKDGEATILANPRTVSMGGKESLIMIRKTLNYFFKETSEEGGQAITLMKKSDISADTEGRITPTLLPNGQIHLVVDVKVGTFTFTPDAGLPEQTTRQCTTQVIVEQGQTIIIGGLRQQEMGRSTTKVPVLCDIPLLGPLFKKEETVVRNSVLTILITPRVLTADNPIPEWPQVNIEDHNSVPIMGETPKTRQK